MVGTWGSEDLPSRGSSKAKRAESAAKKSHLMAHLLLQLLCARRSARIHKAFESLQNRRALLIISGCGVRLDCAAGKLERRRAVTRRLPRQRDHSVRAPSFTGGFAASKARSSAVASSNRPSFTGAEIICARARGDGRLDASTLSASCNASWNCCACSHASPGNERRHLCDSCEARHPRWMRSSTSSAGTGLDTSTPI